MKIKSFPAKSRSSFYFCFPKNFILIPTLLMCKREADSNYLYTKVNYFNLVLNFYSFKVKPRLNTTNKISTIFLVLKLNKNV